MSRGTWVSYPGIPIPFRLQVYHLLWLSFPAPSTMEVDSPRSPCEDFRQKPVTSRIQRSQALTYTEFRLIPFRSPLLRESRLISLPEGTEMFQFPSFASRHYVFMTGYLDITRDGFSHSEISGSKPV